MKKPRMSVHIGIYLLISTCVLAMIAPLRVDGGVSRKPVRLSLFLSRPNVDVQESILLTVRFRDLENNFVENDRDRTIEIEVDRSSQGSGSISPNPVLVRAGAKEAQARFKGQAVGIVILRAKSQGLEPNNTYIGVRSRSSKFDGFRGVLKALLTPAFSHAQPPLSAQSALLLHLDVDSVPANGISPVGFGIFLQSPLPEDQEVRFRTEGPSVQIRIGGNDRGTTRIKKGDLLPVDNPLELIPGTEVGKATIIATAFPASLRAQGHIDLIQPMPAGLLVQIFPRKLVSRLLFPSDNATIDVKLVDSDKGQVQENNKDRVVSISTNHPNVSPKVAELNIRQHQLQNSTVLLLSTKFGLPERAIISVRDKDGNLKEDNAEVEILPLTLLLLVSGFGGAVGGILRYGFKEARKSLLPSQSNTGIPVSILLSAFIGVLAVIGVLLRVLPIATGIDIHDLFGTELSQVATFFVGAMAGYGGDAVLNRIYQSAFGGSGDSSSQHLRAS